MSQGTHKKKSKNRRKKETGKIFKKKKNRKQKQKTTDKINKDMRAQMGSETAQKIAFFT